MNWVKHELDCRHDSLPKLMEHVRLSLASQEYIVVNVVDEPLIKNNPNCMSFFHHYALTVNLLSYIIILIFLGKDFIIEALKFHILKKNPQITMPRTIRNSPRQTGPKVLLNSDFKLSLQCHSIYLYFFCSFFFPRVI